MTFEHEGATVELELKDSYDLCYVDYRDELTPEQVAHIVRGDMEALWDSVADWEADSRYEGAAYYADELLKDAATDALDFADADELRSEVIVEIQERDSSDLVGELAAHTGAVLLRIAVLDEDHAFSFEEVAPEQVLHAVGFPAPFTEANLRTVKYALAEASPEFGVLMGYWVLGADVYDLYKLPYDVAEVEIINPYLYLGNPFAGSGFITEEPLSGVVRVKRDELRTDKDAFGYSLDEVYGGLSPSSFTCELAAVPTTELESD